MSTATAEQVQTTFKMIELAKITPSPMNPRKHFDEQALKDLAASIKSHGVQQPIVVRPDGNKKEKYEIVVGERRFRASKIAGQENIPAIIRPLSNAAALEIMVIENLQREDVHPLDEALGYEALMKKSPDEEVEFGPLPGTPKHTAESIAAKVGKSVGYVYARLKLLALIPAAREAFQVNRITAGHAVLVARLTPSDQVAALFACFQIHHDPREIKKLDFASCKFADLIDDTYAGLIPEKGLREWIQENVNLRLKDVPWDLEDANLVAEAGACSTCLKRSTSNPALFAELAVKGEDTCFDAECFKNKRAQFVKIQLHVDKVKARVAEREGAEAAEKLVQLSDMRAYTKAKPDQAVYRQGQWISAKAGSCPNVRKGILVRGENAGQQKTVCTDDKCKVHEHNLHAERSSAGRQEYDQDAGTFKRHRANIADKKKARARGILCQEMVKHVGAKLPAELFREIFQNLHNERRDESQIISWLLGEKKPLGYDELEAAVAKADGARLNKLVTAVLFTDLLSGWGVNDKTSREELTKLAKSVGIKDGGKILASADKVIGAAKSCRACGCTEEIPCEFWKGGKQVACSWAEDDLCSNPDCAKHEAKKAKAK